MEFVVVMDDGASASPSSRFSLEASAGEGRRQTPTPEQSAAPRSSPLSVQKSNGEREWERVTAIVPCLDEEEAIGACVAAVLAQGVGEVIVVDGGSKDRTAERAAAAGARVVVEPQRGYGRAMMAGIAALQPATSVVLFIDGDGSDRPEMIPAVLAPIQSGSADFVLGSRLSGEREPGSLAPAQIVAGHLAGLLIRLLYGVRFTDMSPFRAIRRDVLAGLGMREATFGWNLEMQMRVAATGQRSVELAVGQRRRVGGVSKVSGSWFSAVHAAIVLLSTFARLTLELRRTGR